MEVEVLGRRILTVIVILVEPQVVEAEVALELLEQIPLEEVEALGQMVDLAL